MPKTKPKSTNLDGDVQLALASIAAELRVDLGALPDSIRTRILATLRALSAAHYNAGLRDMVARLSRRAAASNDSDDDGAESVTSSKDMTPVVGPHGRKMRASRRPTPLVPPPNDQGEDGEHGGTQ